MMTVPNSQLSPDRPVVALEKLGAVIPDGDEKEWLQQRPSPLLGIEAFSHAEREELVTAWRRFLERVAG